MSESSEVQALEKISTEVGESQIKITLSSQCIKAQAFLVDKLKKQIERQREICSFVSSNNFKLQSEIKEAELEIKSLIIAHETIKSGNTELKKELLLAKEKKVEIAERVRNGENKYEALWLESKERYESIPFVQKLLQANSKLKKLKDDIVVLENQSQGLICELNTKKEYYANLDKSRIIELADYLVHVLPKTIKAIRDKTMAINDIEKEMKCNVKELEPIVDASTIEASKINKETMCDKMKNTKLDDGWMNITTSIESDMMLKMPRIQFMSSDFDALNAKLDQIKIMKVEIMKTPQKRLNPTENVTDISEKRLKDDEFSIFFNNRNSTNTDTDKEKKGDTYSSKKLINILDSVKLDKNEAYNMVSKINLYSLKGVNLIGNDSKKVGENYLDRKPTHVEESEIIEEINLTKPITDKNNSSILIPPTQFLDLSQEKLFSNTQQEVEVIVHMSMTEPTAGNLSQSLKEIVSKKRVSFDLPLAIQEITNETNENKLEHNDEVIVDKPNETLDSQMDISLVSDESYSKIKDMILKKHNLDLSPQFVYPKNNIIQLNNDETITSKFFQPDKVIDINDDENKIEKISHASKEHENQQLPNTQVTENINEEEMEVDEVVVSSPKASQKMKPDRTVSGLLFNHGSQGIPDSLNVSISTTGFEEGDTDFPHCIDSSLLLSPKADLPVNVGGDNIDVISQEVPNFLSGLRKTGLSFFGQSTGSKSETSGQNVGNNFNFNFGGSEQKTRGGLFSMFR